MDKKAVISNFINYLRFQHRMQVKEIMQKTGLSRSSLLDLEKSKKEVTDYTWISFENGFGEEFHEYVDNIGDSLDATHTPPAKPSNYDLQKLAEALAEMSIRYSDAVDRSIELKKENDALREEIKRIKEN